MNYVNTIKAVEAFCESWFQMEETGDEECDAEDLESMKAQARALIDCAIERCAQVADEHATARDEDVQFAGKYGHALVAQAASDKQQEAQTIARDIRALCLAKATPEVK